MAYLHILYSIFLLDLILWQANAEPFEDKIALLDFVNQFSHSRPLNWDENSSVCTNWTGVTCNEDESRVIAVRLPGIGFLGEIPPNTISRLSALEIVSLRSNFISGNFPSEFYELKNLSVLYLQFNNLSGSLPDFSVWKNLTIVNLSNNGFNGSIPLSVSNLTELAGLNLANNSLSGEIPDIELPSLQLLNLSNNMLNGSVPSSLQRFPESAFIGNNISFGNHVHISPVLPPSLKPSSKSKKHGGLGEAALLGISIAVGVLALLAFCFLMFVCFSRRRDEDGFSGKLQKGGMSPEKEVSRNQDGVTNLFSLRDVTMPLTWRIC